MGLYEAIIVRQYDIPCRIGCPAYSIVTPIAIRLGQAFYDQPVEAWSNAMGMITEDAPW